MDAGIPRPPEQCAAHTHGRYSSRCTFRPQAGKNYCKIHDPKIISAKAAERHRKWEEGYEAGQKRKEEAERLPNAAPALLEACKAANIVLLQQKSIPPEQQEILDVLQAAIKLAEGR